MEYSQTAANLSPEMVKKLQIAIEIGRWENGERLTSGQLDSAMQAVMLWQAANVNNKDAEPFIVGSGGEMFTGKGETHKSVLPAGIDESNIIKQSKV